VKLKVHRARDPKTEHQFGDGRREATYGTPFPSGWYRILESRDLRPGEVRSVDALGHHLVAFRGKSGSVGVMDAHCPHQGASLAGGVVEGDTLRCPFHFWAFGTDGKLCDIPGLEKIPRASTCTYPTVEQHGMIWFYHHVSGDAVTPPYPADPVAPIADQKMTFRGRYDAGIARMHLTEFIENSVDFQHFAHVHGRLTVPWSYWTIPGFGLVNQPSWWANPEHAHLAHFAVDSFVTFRGKPLEKSRTHTEVTMFGPAGVVWFHFKLPDVGELILFETHLPVAPLEQHVVFRWYAEPRVPSWIAWLVVGQWVANWKADLRIWENKVFRPKPVLVSLDGPVREMRRWHRQFEDDGAPEPKALPAAGTGT
jgi:cholesterol 7-dehydrogenase